MPQPPKIKHNILANLLGRGWVMLMALAFVPLYIAFLGIESYGIIGFYTTLSAVFSILDLGIGTTLNRELARRSVDPDQAQEMRDLVRTLEIIYWGIAVLIGLLVILLAPFIARHWLQGEHLPQSTIEQAIMLMGLVMVVQWPIMFYSGGLNGLQHQVLNNVLASGVATLRGAGAVLVLWLVSPTLEAYFLWQIAVSLLGVVLTGFFLWRRLPKGAGPPRFRFDQFRSVWRFAAGMSGISIVSLLLVQTDKFLLSTLLPLKMFGYYTLASSVAAASVFLVAPIVTAILPKFSQIVAVGDETGLAKLYHQASQLASVAIIPPVLMVVFFSYDLLYLWTGSLTTTQNTFILVSLLAIGYGLNGLMYMPYTLQLASGWPGLALKINTVAVLVLVPALFFIVPRYGAIGAALVWGGLNLGYLTIGIYLMHRRLLVNEKWSWYKVDVLAPLAVALLAVSLCWWLKPEGLNWFASFGWLAGSGVVVWLAAISGAPTLRPKMLTILRRPCHLYRFSTNV